MAGADGYDSSEDRLHVCGFRLPHGMNMRSTILSLGLALLAGGLATAAPAQTGAEDAGVFEIQVNGRGVGQERFSLRQTGVGPNAEFVATGQEKTATSGWTHSDASFAWRFRIGTTPRSALKFRFRSA